MRINPVITTNTFKTNETKNVKPITIYERPKQKGLTKSEKIGIGVFSAVVLGASIFVGIIEHKKPPRKSFEKILEKNGLEFKDKILVRKENGEKFTGELKRSTGKPDQFKGKEMIETQKFKDGIITEKTYTDWSGREIEGDFYLDGKIRLHVSGVIENNKMRFGFNDYDKNGKPISLGDGLMDKEESIFEWAREYIKSHGWK